MEQDLEYSTPNKTQLDNYLESQPPSQLNNLYQFCKAMDLMTYEQVQEIVDRYSSNIFKQEAEDNDSLQFKLKQDSIKVQFVSKPNITLAVVDLVLVDTIIGEIINFTPIDDENQEWNRLTKKAVSFKFLVTEIAYISQVLKDFIRYQSYIEDNQIEFQIFLDELYKFRYFIGDHYKVKEALEIIMNEELMSTRGQVNQNDQYLSEEKQYQTDGIKSAKTPAIKEFKTVINEYGQVEINDDSELKVQLNGLKGKLDQIEVQLDDGQNQAETIDVSEAISPEKRKKLTNEQISKIREKALFEIFKFYSQQHLLGGNKMTFDDINKEGSKLTSGDYYKFCTDFELPLAKQNLAEIYRRKIKREHQDLEYATFKEVLVGIFREVNENQINQKYKDKEVIENLIYEKQTRKEELQYSTYNHQASSNLNSERNFDDDENDEDQNERRQRKINNKTNKHKVNSQEVTDQLEELQENLNQLQKKLDIINNEIDELQNKSDFMEAAHIFLQTDQKAQFMKKMKGFQKPFGTKGKLSHHKFLNDEYTGHTNNNIATMAMGQNKPIVEPSPDKTAKNLIEINRSNTSKKDLGGLKQQLLKIQKDKEAFDREKIKEMTIKKLRMQRNLANAVDTSASYTLEKLRNLQTHKDLLDVGDNMEKILGLDDAQAQAMAKQSVSYDISYKPSVDLSQGAQQRQRIPHVSQSVDLRQNNYYQKMMSRVKEIENVSQGLERQKKQQAYNIHMKRLSVNKSVVNAYSGEGNNAVSRNIGASYQAIPGRTGISKGQDKSIRTSSLVQSMIKL